MTHADTVTRTLFRTTAGVPAPPLRWARELARLVLPVSCPGCGRADVRCCRACAALLGGALRRVERTAPRLDRLDGVPPLPVWAAARYAGPVREVVVAWKDHGRLDLDRVLGPALRRAGGEVASAVRPAAGGRTVLVVPAPSTGAARRSRGREHVAVLAAAVALGLRDGGVPACVRTALRRRGRGRDQVGLGARARGRNLAGGVVVRPRALPVDAGRPICLLVDDVLTTGATLAAAERALEAAGADVVAALVVAATPPPGDRETCTREPPFPVYPAGGVGLA
ncbi:ComF family protein [Isoptericola hypogeus]|uniref:ComF family protein n=1 Tax=Isoptericola hypogeus TaxID=300179 RepID=A0ABN2IQP4_9MICO